MLGDRIVFSSEAGIVAMFDLESGTHLWTERCRASFSGCVVADDRLLLAGGDGHLWVLEAA